MTAPTHTALTRELPGDLDTPVGAYLKLGNRPYSFLFESMEGGERWGRYSFIGLPCREVLRVRGAHIERRVDGEVVEAFDHAQPLEWLKDYASCCQVPETPGLPRFAGGLVGYFGYDCVRYVEPRINRDKPDPLDTPDILLMRADELVMFDSLRATLTLVVHARIGDAADNARAQARLDEIEALLAQPLPAREKVSAPAAKAEFVSGFTPETYGVAIGRIKEYIKAGDVMQVVPSQRLTASFTAEPLALYRALRRINPSPYLFCLHLDDHHVVGSSPEVLVRVEDDLMTVRPIAGTRPRGKTPEEDARLEAELLADPKELAEHLMLIDLGRNDVGRVAETGSVRLTEKMVIERYSHVMHIVSNVTGRLKPDMHPLDALMAAFPAGTLSGAPKVRAMEIIDELEPVRRGVYGGAVGYLSYSGNLDMAIAIRTAVIKDGHLYVQAGGGVVADSNARAEWEETHEQGRRDVAGGGESVGRGGKSATGTRKAAMAARTDSVPRPGSKPGVRAISTAYHLLDARNWNSMQQHGLLSARRLMEMSGETDGGAWRRHRISGERLACGAQIRDQRPMPPATLKRCLRNGMQPEDWFALINSKVFFWLDVERLNRQRLACGTQAQRVLVIDAERLLSVHGAAAAVSPINTGNAMRAAAPRNLSTLVPYGRWVSDGWAHEQITGARTRPPGHRPVELMIADAVPDIMSFVTTVIPLAAGQTLSRQQIATARC